MIRSDREKDQSSYFRTEGDLNEDKAMEYGISDYALAREMVRIGRTVLSLLGEDSQEDEE